jgi:hypothetical protein
MSRANAGFVVAYCFLVILPVLGFLGVLQQGHGMSAPLSVEGTWRLQVNEAELARLFCEEPTAGKQDSRVTISQSGKNLMLEWYGRTGAGGSGVIEGRTVTATLLPSQAVPTTSCAAGRWLTLNAMVETHDNRRSLAGKLSAEACPNCVVLEFRATRQALPPSEVH